MNGHQSTQHHHRQGVDNEMVEAAMEKWHQRNANQPLCRARNDSVLAQPIIEQGVDHPNDPHQGHEYGHGCGYGSNCGFEGIRFLHWCGPKGTKSYTIYRLYLTL